MHGTDGRFSAACWSDRERGEGARMTEQTQGSVEFGQPAEGLRPGSLKAWLMLPRLHFIPLTLIVGSLGAAIAAYDGFFDLGYFVLALIGSLLVHMTVNVINDYHDYRDGIDLNTERTPFSGGSGILTGYLLT